jgi:hypothetical protein
VALSAAGRVFANHREHLGASKQHHFFHAPLGRLDSLNCIVGEHALVEPVIGLECRFVSEQNLRKLSGSRKAVEANDLDREHVIIEFAG